MSNLAPKPPASLRFSPPHRLALLLGSLHKRENAAAKLAFYGAELPFVWAFGDGQYRLHKLDWLVIGANPLLAAMAAHRGLRHGLNVGILQVPGDDLWHFPFLRSPMFRRFIDQALELSSREQLAHEAMNPWLPRLDIGGDDKEDAPVKLWLADLYERLIGSSAHELPGRLFRFDPEQTARLADEHSDYEAMLRFTPTPDALPLVASRVDATHKLASEAFTGILARHARRLSWRDTPSSGRYVFARKLVLTSLTNHLAKATSAENGRLIYDHPHLVALGTADHTAVPREAVLRQAIGDILAVARLDEKAGAPPRFVSQSDPAADAPPPESGTIRDAP